ncbi:hypothetical protein Lalb_Chr07g0179141 [Lupinus albus]|uniref:Uncharacterized protein n=1 Tax=Lupinus albus TaxID=3870 RepID=A0A6A4Q7A8_LUPAL|nr:hypothetical protein Lalb_Chr07g0179141 [Lupinus albus]
MHLSHDLWQYVCVPHSPTIFFHALNHSIFHFFPYQILGFSIPTCFFSLG